MKTDRKLFSRRIDPFLPEHRTIGKTQLLNAIRFPPVCSHKSECIHTSGETTGAPSRVGIMYVNVLLRYFDYVLHKQRCGLRLAVSNHHVRRMPRIPRLLPLFTETTLQNPRIEL